MNDTINKYIGLRNRLIPSILSQKVTREHAFTKILFCPSNYVIKRVKDVDFFKLHHCKLIFFYSKYCSPLMDFGCPRGSGIKWKVLSLPYKITDFEVINRVL